MEERNRAHSQPRAPSLTPRAVPRHLRTAAALAAAVQGFINASPPRAESQTLHAQLLTSGLRATTGLSVKLLVLHIRCGSLHNARSVFDGMPTPTHAAHNYLVAGYFRRGLPGEALGVVRRLAGTTGRVDVFALSMALKLSAALPLPAVFLREVHARVVRSVVGFDEILFAALVDAYVKNGSLGYARRVHGMMPVRSVVCSTALAVGCMNEGLYEDAEAIFVGMVEKDVVAYNAMVEGYSKTEETAEGSLEVFKAMLQAGFRPTLSTFVSILGACSLLSSPELGEQVHCQAIKSSLFCDIKAGSALVDMYSKCGRVEDGRRIFDRMLERNVVTWTSMIDGYGKNGLSDEALQLFGEMRKRQDVSPNHTTFLSVLSGCAHAGLLSQGQEVFQSMESEYSLRPRMEHYACMVDLLGRFGSVRQAYDFIRGIPARPNSDVWAALLGAATLHGDGDLADVAAREVFELSRAGRPGAYMAFSNTLAAAGKWDGVHDVRETMKRRGVLKDAACSWVGSENSPPVD
ncbi:pentatricopeptide repeat-containing protein At1g28690, mitochondrial [Phragmites australis]|uniref:pentatricopeptide repeat-containing protein At1g28690, mitochondrial n=1 Tax=Phragmites australis TaxID=29695 RepID=UPI002D7A3DD7|nr:pentatricopeptide repeat-containing protein At1g28690, mitochondrial [Phragmites australis]